ncbi:LysE family translocator [Acerihabitans arboris]|uniref:LysE family transporter n=1 Tax=Acerihabitans arboris TaxID=2691583 RepID=A0A845SGW3_9GAMM|nr:LysE family translocator [Acerihabitans arboris]NDL61871.1 LysE family transporter [Acerihabitans arboris]
MLETSQFLPFAAIALGLVLTPGPNMIYLVSRSVCQGPKAGMISLGGVALGFVFYMLFAALGITALLMAIPFAYDSLRFAGALYLLYLAWQAVRRDGSSPFQVRRLSRDSTPRLFAMGLLTSILNPKVAILYLSLLPQFIIPAHGHIFSQSLMLGLTQIIISVSVNALIAWSAASIAAFFGARPLWLTLQRWIMASVLAGLALRMAAEGRR